MRIFPDEPCAHDFGPKQGLPGRKAMKRLTPLACVLLLLLALLLMLGACSIAPTQTPATPRAPIDEVDVFIGTAGEGNVYPGVSLPFGFVQPGPDTGPGSGAAGYKFDKPIVGFSQQHISGMGGPLYGQISLMPLTGALGTPSNIVATGKSREAASPGFYTVTLAPWDVKVELTATSHVALHRHTFPAHAQSRVVLDVGHCLYGTGASWSSAKPIGGEFSIDTAAREVSGHMTYQGGRSDKRTWKVFFVLHLDSHFASVQTWGDDEITTGAQQRSGSNIGAVFTLRTRAGQVVNSKIALSYRSIEQARGYIAQQTPGWDFETVRAQARDIWSQALGRIAIEGGTPDQRTQFYTALYRTHLTPNDWTGEAPDRYGSRVVFENILCLWDTFRTVNPLLTLIQPQVQAGIVNTLLAHHQIDGWTGDAHSAHHYEHVQNGSSADVVIADAYLKHLPGIDWRAAYAAIRKNAFVDFNPQADNRPNQGRFRLDDYRRLGWLPTDTSPYRAVQSVSRTLEYIYNDAAVLTLARAFGTPEDVADLQGRMGWYRHLWDPATGFMRGKTHSGAWHEPFDPLKAETGKQYYEGHAWTWSWYVPHDVPGLMALHGGRERFIAKLTTAVEQHYEAYNEPGMLQTYLFTHAGRPDLTQKHVRAALRHFSARPDGLPGNDDSGTTSAWLVWAMLGLYPHAGQDLYYIGSPLFTKATLQLAQGKTLVIEAPGAAAGHPHVAQAALNGQALNHAWLRHADIAQGARLLLQMQAEPTSWGADIAPPPHPAIAPAAPSAPP